MKKTIEETTRLLLQGTLAKDEADKILLSLSNVSNQREQLIAFLRQQSKLRYITIYENDFEFADKLLKAINCC